jgi:L-arabinonolactonase
MEITCLAVPKCSVGEGPGLGCAECQNYFWIDILEKAVYRLDPATGKTQRWPVPKIIGSMAISRDGGAIVALASGVHTLDFATGEVPHAGHQPRPERPGAAG